MRPADIRRIPLAAMFVALGVVVLVQSFVGIGFVFWPVLLAAVGLAFGWLFWRHGLEFAMLAHFCADLVLHVVTVSLHLLDFVRD